MNSGYVVAAIWDVAISESLVEHSLSELIGSQSRTFVLDLDPFFLPGELHATFLDEFDYPGQFFGVEPQAVLFA